MNSNETGTQPNNNDTATSLVQKLQSVVSVSEILRILGASAVLMSMSLYLLEGWAEGNDLSRYLKLLLQTGLLGVAGWILATVLKEVKGARLFFGLGLVSTVANFTILGALIYSMVQWDVGLTQYPDFVSWKAVDFWSFLPIFIGAVIFLSVLSRFSFSIFARKLAPQLTLSFLLVNSLLLIPARGSWSVAILLFIAFALIFRQLTVALRGSENALSAENKFAFCTLLIAPAIILIRAISFYHIDELLWLVLSAIAYFSIRFYIVDSRREMLKDLSVFEQQDLKKPLERGTFIERWAPRCLASAGMCVAWNAMYVFDSLTPFSMYAMQFFWALVLILMADQLRLGSTPRFNKLLLTATTIAVAITNVANALWFTNFIGEFYCLALACFSYVIASKANSNLDLASDSTRVAMLGVISVVAVLIYDAIKHIDISSWVLFSVLGMVLIIGGSLFEKYGLRFLKK